MSTTLKERFDHCWPSLETMLRDDRTLDAAHRMRELVAQDDGDTKAKTLHEHREQIRLHRKVNNLRSSEPILKFTGQAGLANWLFVTRRDGPILIYDLLRKLGLQRVEHQRWTRPGEAANYDAIEANVIRREVAAAIAPSIPPLLDFYRAMREPVEPAPFHADPFERLKLIDAALAEAEAELNCLPTPDDMLPLIAAAAGSAALFGGNVDLSHEHLVWSGRQHMGGVSYAFAGGNGGKQSMDEALKAQIEIDLAPFRNSWSHELMAA
jgi:hypothetical protein